MPRPIFVIAQCVLALLLAVAAGRMPAASASNLEDAVHGGVLVRGTDRATIELPGGAEVTSYRNDGYRLEVGSGRAQVAVEVQPFGDTPVFVPVEGSVEGADDAILGLARSLTLAQRTRYEASSALLGWITRNVRYELDRSKGQDARQVLARRAGYCTGIAALAVELHRAVGIPAREVPGLVFDDITPGYHRWIEVELAPGRWVFSDPLRFHHFVPAQFVPLATDLVTNPSPAVRGRIKERQDEIEPVDLFSGVTPSVAARPRDTRRRFAALRVSGSSLPEEATGGQTNEPRGGVTQRTQRDQWRVVLSGTRWRRVRALEPSRREGGALWMAVFVGLSAGRYELWLEHRWQEPGSDADRGGEWARVGAALPVSLEGAELLHLRW